MTVNAVVAETQPGLVRRALAGHGALGLLVAGLLYIVALTGTLAVMHDRWQRWEQPGVPEFVMLSPAAAQAAMVTAVAEAGPSPVTLQLPTDDLPRAIVSTARGSWYLDRTGRRTARVAAGWTDFIVALHETLLLPASWGYALVGALGVALGSLCLTGVLAHPRIVRDAFRLRWRQGAPIARVDWHNRLGVWTLPFTIAVALTGAVLGLGTVAFALLAAMYNGGDVQRAYAPVYGGVPAADARPAPLPNIAAALATLHARAPRARPVTLTVTAPGTRGEETAIIAVQPRRLIYGEAYRFDARGRLLGTVGLADGTLGQQAAASAYGLHFGDRGGLALELAYVAFGTALCAIVATGPWIWLHKRRRRGLGGARLSACWNAGVWGTPILLLLAAGLRAALGDRAPLTLFFWCGLAAVTALAAIRPAWISLKQCRSVMPSRPRPTARP